MSEFDLTRSPRRTVMRASWSLGERKFSSRPRGTNGIAKPAASSSRRSSRSLRSLVIPTQTTMPTMSTGIAAPMAVASTTRVRSDGVRAKIRDRMFMSTASGLLHSQHEPDPTDGVQQPGTAVGLQLAAQVADEHVDDVGVGGEVIAPHQLEQLRARQHRSLVLGKDRQQVEFPLGQVDVDTIDPGPTTRDVD